MRNTPERVEELKIQVENAIKNHIIVDIETLKGYKVAGIIRELTRQGQWHEITYDTQHLSGKKLFLEHIKIIFVNEIISQSLDEYLKKITKLKK